MQVSVLAQRDLRISNKEIECLIQNFLVLASLKNAENSKFMKKVIRAHQRRSYFLDKVADWRPGTLSKTGSSTGVFQ